MSTWVQDLNFDGVEVKEIAGMISNEEVDYIKRKTMIYNYPEDLIKEYVFDFYSEKEAYIRINELL